MKSGYDLNNKIPFNLIKGRLGVYEKETYDASKMGIEGVDHQEARL